jgi:hypothetical protein
MKLGLLLEGLWMWEVGVFIGGKEERGGGTWE